MGCSVINPEAEFSLLESDQSRVWRGHVCGSSMVPTLRRGDRITVMRGDKYRLGEIVLFARNGSFIIHRAFGILPGRIITKGDASYHLDPPVLPQDILGRAVIRERDGKVQVLDSCGARWWGLILGLGALVFYPVFEFLRPRLAVWKNRRRSALP